MLRLNYHRRNWIKRDRELRKKYKLIEINKIVLKSLIANTNNLEAKIYYTRLLHKFPNKISISYFRNGCYNSGTGRSVFRQFRLNRNECKVLSSYGYLVGMRKSSF